VATVTTTYSAYSLLYCFPRGHSTRIPTLHWNSHITYSIHCTSECHCHNVVLLSLSAQNRCKTAGAGKCSRYGDSLQTGRAGDQTQEAESVFLLSIHVQDLREAHIPSPTTSTEVLLRGKAAGAWICASTASRRDVQYE
jgi:hypothetical protein